MSEMLTGLKKIVDGLTEVFRGLTRMCEGMAEQIELLELTSEDAEDEDKRLPPAKLPAVDTAPRVQDVPHPRKKPGKRPRKQEQDARTTMEETPKEPTEEAQAEESLMRRRKRNFLISRMTRQMTCPLIWTPPKRRKPNSLR